MIDLPKNLFGIPIVENDELEEEDEPTLGDLTHYTTWVLTAKDEAE